MDELPTAAPNEEFSRVEQSAAYAFLSEFSISGSPKRVLTPLKKYFKSAYATLCSTVQNLRLGSIKFMAPNFTPPKRRFWKVEHTFQKLSQNVFSKHFPRETSHFHASDEKHMKNVDKMGV